STTRTR
ncbi:hypothetical protein VCHENC02_1776B, partial [Vibrio harveyi]